MASSTSSNGAADMENTEGSSKSDEQSEDGSPEYSRCAALTKDDSGITLGSCGKSPSIKEAVSDADMTDPDWVYDSALPSSSLSESGAESKSEGSPSSKIGSELEQEACASSSHIKEDPMSVERDELLNLDTEIEMSSPSCTAVSSANSGSSPRSKRSPEGEDKDESPQPKRKTPEKWDDEEDIETGVGASGTADKPSTDDTTEEQPSEDLSDLSSSSSDEEEQSASAAQKRSSTTRRGRFRFGVTSSDDSDSSNDDDNDNDDSKLTDEEEDKEWDEEVLKATSETLNKVQPKPNWFALPELRRREYGCSRRESTDSFRERVQGSLQMVKRLVLQDTMKGHEGCVNALSFNRIGTLLASGSDDLNIILWNWQRARPSLIYDSGHRSNVFQAKFMPFSGDCHVISCARDGQVRLAELSLTGVCKNTRKLAQHKGAAHKLALEMDSPNVFLSCGEDAVTFLFDLREERPHKLVTTKEGEKKVPLYSIHSNPRDSRQFCVGGRDPYIRVYDKRKISEEVDGGVLKKLCPDHLVNSDLKANVTCACYNYNGSEILGTYNDEDIYLFDNTMSDGANYIHRYTGHRNNATVKGVNFYGPKSEFIVSGSDCGNVYFWDKETEAIINFQEGDEAGVINVLEPHPTLPLLATSGLDHDVKLWLPSPQVPEIDQDKLKKTVKKNHVDRCAERISEPEVIGGQMLWFLMHHFRNSARRRMREEGQAVSTSEDDDDDDMDSDDDGARNDVQCAQS